MIPVPQECVYLLDIKNKNYGYKRLLSEQYSYINTTANKEKILENLTTHWRSGTKQIVQ